MSKNWVVVGGGAGGLELVVRLARKHRRSRDLNIILVDKNPTHIWKPLFHEVATGSMNSSQDETSYRMLARKHGFKFSLGRVDVINTSGKTIEMAPIVDDSGEEIVPGRTLGYHRLVVSVGSQSNDFGLDGVREFSRQLDSLEQAEAFHKIFAAQLFRVNAAIEGQAKLSVAIVGGGATGVELAADMHNVVARLGEYGFEHFPRERLRVSIIEAAPRLLPRLPKRIGQSVESELTRLGVSVQTSTRVAAVARDHVLTSNGDQIAADISVWAAGVKAPGWLADSGFATDHLGRIRVERDLTVVGQASVFALGDCAHCQSDDGSEVPPRAQAAHQMASVVYKNLVRQRAGKPLKPFVYRDFGSLVSLSQYSTVGNLMGNLMRGTVFVEGWVARLVYLSLYRMHQSAIHGRFSTLLIMLGDRIYKATRAEVKLH